MVDVYSRFPVSDPDQDDLLESADSHGLLLAASLPDLEDGVPILEDPHITGVREAASRSCEYQRLKVLIRRGFPEKVQLDEDITPYWKIRHNLSIQDDLIFLGSRLLIPKILRPRALKSLHSAHQGITRTLQRARQAVFWPNITNHIYNIIKSCQECQSFLPSQPKEPKMSDPSPQFPFEQVAVDLFSYNGNEYLVMVDPLSGWLSVAKCGQSASSAGIIGHLKKWFTDFGIPVKLISDNGPQFSSLEFQNWCKNWSILHTTSSPHFPASNGLAEAAIKSVKYLLSKCSNTGDIKCDEFQRGLQELRNTPGVDGRSPSQLLFGAPTRSTIPFHRHQFIKLWKDKSIECDQRAVLLREKATTRYDKSAHPHPHFTIGDIVFVQDHRTHRWTMVAEVIGVHSRRRSYTLRSESGRLFRRNRRYLRTYHPSSGSNLPVVDTSLDGPRRSTRTRRPAQRFAFQLEYSPSEHL